MKKRKKALDVYTQNQILCSVICLIFILGFIIVCLSIQPEYHVYNTCIGVGEWPFILFPDLLYSF